MKKILNSDWGFFLVKLHSNIANFCFDDDDRILFTTARKAYY